MTNLISPIEAFRSMLLRKKVLARFKNSGSDLDFVDIKTLPADVFIDSDYEFCIQKEMVELSGFNFTKPLNFPDVQNGQEIFIVMPTCILHRKYDSEHDDIRKSVEHGFVQADVENAKLQIMAMAKTFGFYVEEIGVKEGFEEKPKRRKSRQTKMTADAYESLSDRNESETNSEPEISPVPEAQEQQAPVIQSEADDPFLAAKSAVLAAVSPTLELPENYQTTLDDLIARASKAQSPTEANALFRYTKGWTREQLAPLHAAVSRRLAELPQPEVQDPPSLLVRIKRATNKAELDDLEVEVNGRDAFIQKALMDEVKKRRFQLENQ